MSAIAIFASGSGSNMEAIMEAIEDQRIDAEAVLVVSDKPQAYVLERAAQYDVSTFSFRPSDYENKASYEQDILEQCRAYEVDWIVLAGYMRLLGPTLLDAYENRIINIHPSLLPAFPGKDAIGQAWEAGVKVTGVTVHYVDAGMDTGPIIAQEAITVKETDSLETLTKAVQAVEHRLYPETIAHLLKREQKNVTTK